MDIMDKNGKVTGTSVTGGQLDENEERILISLKEYNSLINEMYEFEGLLYDKTYQLPRVFFKHFRTIREGIDNTFSPLEEFVSYNQEFIEEKDKILAEQIEMTENHVSKSRFKSLAESDVNRRRVDTDHGERGRRGGEADFRQL